MWSTILALLKKRVDEGVVVRIMYDDLGSLQTLEPGYEKKLRQMGFLVGVFNKVKPHLNAKLNYRDHRKILIVDGDVGFTGGINFADEYINRKLRFGHWKDTTVMLKGDAVWNLTMMFSNSGSLPQLKRSINRIYQDESGHPWFCSAFLETVRWTERISANMPIFKL